MKLSAPILFVALSLSLAAPLVAASEAPAGSTSAAKVYGWDDIIGATSRRGNSWALDADVGYLHSFGASPSPVSSFFGRVGAGYLRSQDPLMIEALGFVDHAFGYSTSVGVMGSVTEMVSGFWGELGLLRDFDSRYGVMLSGGWSLFGLEVQVRSPLNGSEPASWGALAKLRVPVGIIWYLAGHAKSHAVN